MKRAMIYGLYLLASLLEDIAFMSLETRMKIWELP